MVESYARDEMSPIRTHKYFPFFCINFYIQVSSTTKPEVRVLCIRAKHEGHSLDSK